jgi:hypothetical protein
MVGTSGIEPPTTTMSRWCSTTELRAYEFMLINHGIHKGGNDSITKSTMQV